MKNIAAIEEVILTAFEIYGLSMNQESLKQYLFNFGGISDNVLIEAIYEHLRQDPINAPVPLLVSRIIHDKISRLTSEITH